MTQAANRRGSGFMVLAMAAFALEDMLFKAATATVPVGQALLQFGALGLVLFALLALRNGERALPKNPFSRGLMVRSGIELAGRLFYALALAYASLGATSAILQATPLVVTLGAVILFREPVGWRRWTAIGLGFVGVLLVLRPTSDAFDIGAVFAVLGMLGFAGRDLATRAARPSVTNAQLGVLGFAVIVCAGGVVTVATGAHLTPPPPSAVAQLAGASILGVIAYASLTTAMRTGEVSVVTPFRYTRLVFALILAVAVFGERPDPMMLLGAALIVGSGVFTLLRSGRKPATATQRD